MIKHYVYLAGPIAGLSYNGCTEWRTLVAGALNSDTVHCLTPMRGKEALQGEEHISAGAYPTPLASQKGITRRDAFDTHRASALFVNLLGATKASIGTVMEIAWAFRANIPVIMIRELRIADPHDHVMLNEAATYIVPTLEEGVRICKILLEPDSASPAVITVKSSFTIPAVTPDGREFDAALPTAKFRITGPGSYRNREGTLVEVIGPYRGDASLGYAWQGETRTDTWMRDGRWWEHGTHSYDIVGPA